MEDVAQDRQVWTRLRMVMLMSVSLRSFLEGLIPQAAATQLIKVAVERTEDLDSAMPATRVNPISDEVDGPEDTFDRDYGRVLDPGCADIIRLNPILR